MKNEIDIINNTELVAVEQLNFNDYLIQFIAYVDVKEKSLNTYRKALKQFIEYLSANNIKQPTRQDIIDFREYLKQEHKATTINLYMTATKLFFKWLEQENLYKNIAEHIKGVKVEKGHKKDCLTAKQCKQLLKSIDTDTLKGKRDKAIISLMLTCGLRTIEVERANREDIKNVAGVKVLFIQGKGKDDKGDYVKLVDDVYNLINNYLEARTDINDCLFCACTKNNVANSRISTRSLRRLVKDRLKAIGINDERITAHSLRHTTATLTLLSGTSLQETQQLLRHSNINTTMIYTHNIERLKSKAESNVAKNIF